jgi:hypothetical protein
MLDMHAFPFGKKHDGGLVALFMRLVGTRIMALCF